MKSLRKLSVPGVMAVGAALLAGFFFTGCASTEDPVFNSSPAVESRKSTATHTSERPPASEGGKLVFQVGDSIRITFSGTTEPILPHEEKIKDDGNITLPLIGAIKALGKTPGELQNEIQSAADAHALVVGRKNDAISEQFQGIFSTINHLCVLVRHADLGE